MREMIGRKWWGSDESDSDSDDGKGARVPGAWFKKGSMR